MFPRNEKPERGHIRQNHPFTKPRPFVSSRSIRGMDSLLIVEHGFACNGSPYGCHCHGSRGLSLLRRSPKKLPKYRTLPRVNYCCLRLPRSVEDCLRIILSVTDISCVALCSALNTQCIIPGCLSDFCIMLSFYPMSLFLRETQSEKKALAI